MSHLSEILNSRENRTKLRLAFAERNLASISLSFNIPGKRKTSPEISKAFDYTVDMLEKFLFANRILTNNNESRRLIDAAGDFYIVPIIESIYETQNPTVNSQQPIADIKSICENFEENHVLGRIIDVDVVDKFGNPISSGKAKKCFICDKSAVECMRQQNHNLQELINFVSNSINKFLIDRKLEDLKINLSAFATQALLFEISLSPKPGLVDRCGSGSHKDMDFFSFLSSTSALSAYWAKIIDLAFYYSQNQSNTDELIKLRVIGIEMEQTMRKFTLGVNTHKGAIFILGMLVYAVAKLTFNGKDLSGENIRNEIIALNKDNLSDELLQLDSHSANGKNVMQKYGQKLGGGIRQEMALGLPIVFEYVLPILQDAYKHDKYFLNSGKTAQKVLTNCLLTIISHNNDSNILHRANDKVLQELKQKAEICLKKVENFEENYKNLCDFCSLKNISPGGSADLLSAAIFVQLVIN